MVRIALAYGGYFSTLWITANLVEDLNEFVEGFERLKITKTSDGGRGRSQTVQEADNGDKYWYTQGLHRPRSCWPFITLTGFVGLGSWHVAAGDELYICSGGKTPYLVWPLRNGIYTLVGEPYVHGMMYGEVSKADLADKAFVLK